jgi:2-enoate reductase
MVAALTAARRGHRVTLYEKESALGGELIPGSQAPFKAEVGRLLEYWRKEVTDAQIEVHLDTEVTLDLLRRERPDALVVAVGAEPKMPHLPGGDGRNVMSAVQAFLEPGTLKGKRVLVLGGGDVGCECALFLAEYGCQVTIVEALDELLLTEEVHSVRVDLLWMLQDAGVEVLTRAEVVAIRESGAIVRSSDGERSLLEADVVVAATGMMPRRHVAHQLAGECADVHIIGDCRAPRHIRDAVLEGERAGRLI